jgi:hypothetical protein
MATDGSSWWSAEPATGGDAHVPGISRGPPGIESQPQPEHNSS